MIRTDDRKYLELVQEAEQNGLSLSEYLRRLITLGQCCVNMDKEQKED